MFIIDQILLHLSGRLFLFIRYGRKSSAIVESKYDGSYSVGARIILLQSFTVLLLLLLAGGFFAMVVYGVNYIIGKI